MPFGIPITWETVELKARRDGDMVLISVKDNGPGISDEVKERVFERFYKVNENNHEGTGIGLSLVKEYTEAFGGRVELNSKEGQGSVFMVWLPYLEEKEGSVVPEKEEIESIEKDDRPVMLIVEDHADLNDFISGYFDTEYRCVSAFDGEEALKYLRKETPDIIISDLMMPKMNGETFVRSVKDHDEWGHIPIVILSAKSATDSRIDLYNIGADNYLVKPFDIGELEAVVQNVLSQRQKLQLHFEQVFLQGEVCSEPESNCPDEKWVRVLVDLAKENLSNEGLNTRFISETLGIGRNKLQQEIKRITGLTPVEFIRSVRLTEAKEMLELENTNVSQVAYSVGFNNLSYFTRSFKAQFGVVPSDWKKEKTESLSKT